MTPFTMTNGAPAEADPTDLASLVAARLCHDLVSPLGAIGNGVELLEMSGAYPGVSTSPELTLIADSISAARARVRFYRAAFGHAPADQRAGVGEIAQLMQDFTAGSRLRVEVDGKGDLSRAEARMLLLSLMCFDSAMPWGGRVIVCRAGHGWRIVGEASRTRISTDLWRWLGGEHQADVPLPAPSEVHFAILGALAMREARPVAWELDATGAEISF